MRCLVQEKRIRARHSMQQLSKQMRDRQLKVQDRVKKQVSSVRNLPRVRRQTLHPPSCSRLRPRWLCAFITPTDVLGPRSLHPLMHSATGACSSQGFSLCRRRAACWVDASVW